MMAHDVRASNEKGSTAAAEEGTLKRGMRCGETDEEFSESKAKLPDRRPSQCPCPRRIR